MPWASEPRDLARTPEMAKLANIVMGEFGCQEHTAGRAWALPHSDDQA